MTNDDVELLSESDLFDHDFYQKQFPNILFDNKSASIRHYLEIGWKDGADPNKAFSTEEYIRQNSDVEAAALNPLVHYIRHGKAERREAYEAIKRRRHVVPAPVRPTQQQWDDLHIVRHSSYELDVIIPVYSGHDETLRCIYSVLTSEQSTPFRVLVVDDCGPEPDLRNEIKRLANEGYIDLIEQKENLGFVRAVNKGMSENTDRDVILLNSDTEVFGDWIDRLRYAASQVDYVGTVTPLSNNAEICSYPRFIKDTPRYAEVSDKDIDEIAAQANSGVLVDIPTAVGFCMYIKRQCIDEVGLFDEQSFGIGYGEENDFCCRASIIGWRHVLAPNIFVRHYGSVSFGDRKAERVKNALKLLTEMYPDYLPSVGRFIEADPALFYRQRIDAFRIRRRFSSPPILFVTHRWGGGIERHIREMADLLEREGTPVLLCRCNSFDDKKITIEDPQTWDTPNIHVIDPDRSLDDFCEILLILNVSLIHVHSFAGLPKSSIDLIRFASSRLNIRYDFTVHDYIPICPRINLVDITGVYCTEPSLSECQICIDRDGSPFGKPSIWRWRANYERFLRDARRIYVPSADVSRRLSKYFLGLDFTLRPHPQTISNTAKTYKSASPYRGRRRIGIVGAIGQAKGSQLLEDTARAASHFNLPVEFVVIGYTDRDRALLEIGNVRITGKYSDSEIQEIISSASLDAIWFPAVWPETFSYTLSECFVSGVTPIAFDLGSIAERIRGVGSGILMPISLMIDPSALATELSKMDLPPSSETIFADLKSYDDMIHNYYNLQTDDVQF